MKIFSVLLTLLMSILSNAAVNTSVGKITSGICNFSDNQLHGSGVVVTVNGEKLLVTSEHAVLAMATACHSANIAGRDYDLDFVISDYRHGLALFKIRKGETLSGFSLEQMQSLKSSSQGSLMTAGFPINSDSILVDKSINVVSLSNRSPFADVEQVLEVKGLHAEKGMSGGALLSSSGETLHGILSHLTAQGGITNSELVLAIPANEVKSWIQSVLQGKTSTLRRDPRSQNSSLKSEAALKESVLGPGIQIQTYSNSVQSSAGGGDGLGIGGADITGDSIQITMTDLATFEMAKSSKELSWLSQIRSGFVGRATVEVEKVVIFQPSNGNFLTIHPKNMSEFLKLMRSQEAIVVLKGDHSEANSLSYSGSALPIIEKLMHSSELTTQNYGVAIKTLFDLKTQHPELRVPDSVVSKLKNHSELSELATQESDGFEMVVTIQKELSSLSIAKPGL